ncbi:MAG: hypothetical protein LBP40_00960 [Campylobacteraceae bacterium]|jgi:hypothetical protein|nr:hypothetical protein [Campylobacteraceae bacterium]
MLSYFSNAARRAGVSGISSNQTLQTNFTALNLFKFKVFFSLSKPIKLLIFFFVLSLFIGCGGSGSTASSAVYSVNFYDNNLDFIKTVNVSAGTDFADIEGLSIASWYAAGESLPVTNPKITADINFYAVSNVREIRTDIELNDIREDLNGTNLTGNYILMNDIVLTSAVLDETAGWEPIAGGGDAVVDKFVGIFNGGGHKITGLYINSTKLYVGLFGFVHEADIKNLGVELERRGIIANISTPAIAYAGGIAGYVENGSIVNSYLKGDITTSMVGDFWNYAETSTGGIAGYIKGDIIDSYSNAEITASITRCCVAYAGGIAGYINGTINAAHSTGNITSNSSNGATAGGIAGHISNGAITNSYSTGSVSAFGGLGSEAVSGGIAGAVSIGNVTNSYSSGNVFAFEGDIGSSFSGGIAGFIKNGTITNSYSTGNITINNGYCNLGFGCGAGGIAGWFREYAVITKSYSTGVITAVGYSGYVGGIVGTTYYSGLHGNFTVADCAAANKEISGGNRITFDEMSVNYEITTINNFANLDMKVNGATVSDNPRNGIGKSLEEFRGLEIYANPVNGDGLGGLGWQFGDDDDNPWKWNADKNGGYPYLYWQEQ